MRRFTLLLLSAAAGCSFALDFDELDGLPCPCDADHVCLIAANRCVSRASVDDFKSCSKDTENGGDDLCKAGRICQGVNDQGPRCLPRCEPSPYALPEADARIAQQCPQATTCWTTDRGGVCSEGVCRDQPNNCPPGQECLRFNGAGVCFTRCGVFQIDPPPCAGDQVCHPIGDYPFTACVPSGGIGRRTPCDERNLCAPRDDFNRPMICARPQQSTAQRQCYPVCQAGDASRCFQGESCTLARPNIEPETRRSLGICTGGF